MVRRLIKNPLLVFKSYRVRLATLIFGGYWLLVPFVNATQLAQMITLVLIFVGLGVMFKYFDQVLEAVITDDRGPFSQLAQGIFLAFTGLVLALIWAMIPRIGAALNASGLLDVPDLSWMRTHPITGFFLLCYVVAGSLHMTVSRDEHGRMVREDIRDVMVAYGLGLLVALVLMLLSIGSVLRPA